jgi:hypothetical protein
MKFVKRYDPAVEKHQIGGVRPQRQRRKAAELQR